MSPFQGWAELLAAFPGRCPGLHCCGLSGLQLLPTNPGRTRGSASSGDGAARTVSVDLVELLDRGDLAFNIEVAGGDVLTIPPRTPGYIFVLGYVQRPGAHELKEGMRIDAMRAVALSGGLLSNARAHNAYLLRGTSEGQQMIRVDLNKTARGIRPPVPLMAGDTLVVGSSFPARLAEYIKPTASVGASFSPGP